jgi:hypothetical protein
MNAWNGRQDRPDESDRQILSEIGDLYQQVDPPPSDLVAWVQALMASDEPVGERFARLDPHGLQPLAFAGSRGGQETAIQLTRDGLEVWITVAGDEAVVALDGWFVDTARYTVDLRAGDDRWTTTTDETGHFTFDVVPRGPIELVIRVVGDEAAGPEAVTFLHDLRE